MSEPAKVDIPAIDWRAALALAVAAELLFATSRAPISRLSAARPRVSLGLAALLL